MRPLRPWTIDQASLLPSSPRDWLPDDDIYYRIKLDFVPNVGDLIDFESMQELADKRPWQKDYEVVKVIHKLRDVTDKSNPPSKGDHFVSVLVKQSSDSAFKR